MVVNVSEAKAKLSKLLDMVYHGQKVTIAKNNLPVADLVPHKPAGSRRLEPNRVGSTSAVRVRRPYLHLVPPGSRPKA
jgi:prevent-host-death family protein